jgi:hypothetical protein
VLPILVMFPLGLFARVGAHKQLIGWRISRAPGRGRG